MAAVLELPHAELTEHEPSRHVERVLFVGDVHGDIGFVSATIRTAVRHSVDAIVQVGDFGVWDHTVKGVAFLDQVDASLEAINVPLVFVEGNHDNHDSLQERPIEANGFRKLRPTIWHAPRGHTWTWGDVRFLAMGGAHSPDGPEGIFKQVRGPGDGWWPQETITPEDLAKAMVNVIGEGDAAWIEDGQDPPHPLVDVLVTHDCPEGVTLPGITGYPAGDANRRLLRTLVGMTRPRLLVGGHYHLRHSDTVLDTDVEILASNLQRSGHHLLVVLAPQFRVKDC